MTDRDELVRRLRDKDQIVIGGLFYCIPVMREAATALSAQQPVGTVEEVTHAYGTKVKWARKMVAGEVLYTAPLEEPLNVHSDEEAVRNLAQRMIGRWNGPSEMLLRLLRLLLRTRPSDHPTPPKGFHHELVPSSPPPAPVSPEAIELAKLMLLPRYTDQDGKVVARELLRMAGK